MSGIAVNNINYRVAKKQILKDISFHVEPGNVLAILGRNGAGKTSLFELMTNIIHTNGGSIAYNGKKTFSSAKANIGVLWDDLNLFPLLKVKEVVRYTQSMLSVKEFPVKFWELLELGAIENEKMEKLSRGEKKRVEILLATMHNPDFLLLDEPTSELDPLIRERIWNNILLREGRTIVFSTHQWEEASSYANNIGFLFNGKLLNQPKSESELLGQYGFVKKVAVDILLEIEASNDIFQYATDQHNIYLLKHNELDFIQFVKNQVQNYSVLPVQLKDIYQFLITKAS